MNIVDQITERLITRRRRIGAEGKDGLRLPVRHSVAAAVRKLPRRIVWALRAVIAPGVVIRADDPDIPFLRVHAKRRSAERITDVILESVEAGAVKVISSASINPDPVAPNTMRNTAMGGVAGLVISLGIIFLTVLLDNKINTEEDVTKYLDLTVVGVIPEYEGGKKK